MVGSYWKKFKSDSKALFLTPDWHCWVVQDFNQGIGSLLEFYANSEVLWRAGRTGGK